MVAHLHTGNCFPSPAATMDPPEAAASVVGNNVEKHELVRQLQFPPGFHFQPTELTLVDFYLRAKIEGRKLPIHVINEVDLLKWQPGELVEAYKGYGESKWYFYWKRVPSSSNKEQEPSRQVHLPGLRGTWKATGSLIMIRRRGKDGKPAGDVVGTKRVLIYHSTDPEEDGNWSMHEYILTTNSQIGQYALYSVQRKQQSDTEPKTGEGEATGTNIEPGTGETTKMRKKAAPGKTRKRRKAATAQQEEQETDILIRPPLTPPLIQDRQTVPQELLPPSAYAPMSLPSVPLQQQGYGNQQLLGISAPMGAGHAQPLSYDVAAQFSMPQTFCNQQGEQPPGLIWDHQYTSNDIDAGQYHQLYQQENHVQFGVLNQDVYAGQYLQQESGFFSDNTTQNNSIWELGVDEDLPYYQQGVEDQQHAYAFQSYDLQGHGGVFAPQEASCGSHEQFTTGADGGAVASEVDDNMASFPDGDLFSPLDLLFCGAEDESNSALQSHQELQMPCEQQQQTDNGGEPPLALPSVLDFGSGVATRDGTF